MTPDQPAAPAGLHPETVVICAGRPGHAGGGPLNVPVVLASNFHAREPGTGEDSRAYVPPRAPAPQRRLRTHRRPLERPELGAGASITAAEPRLEPAPGNGQN